jgi:hypothetical protein
MIGDLILSAYLQFPKQGSDFDVNILARNLGVTGKYALKKAKLVSTSDGTFALDGLASIGVILLRNDGGYLPDTPAAPTVTPVGTGGAATWTYKIVAKKGSAYTVAGAAGSTAVGNATLTTVNYNHIKWAPVGGQNGDDADSYDVYRTASGGTPATLGKIANVLASVTETDINGVKWVFFDDKAIAGDTTTAPATTPFDFSVDFGPDGTSWPIRLRGQDITLTRWNAAALHHKAVVNPTPILGVLIEQ